MPGEYYGPDDARRYAAWLGEGPEDEPETARCPHGLDTDVVECEDCNDDCDDDGEAGAGIGEG